MSKEIIVVYCRITFMGINKKSTKDVNRTILLA
jgi:hypothetical protein